jgi:hypothetical protein
MAGKALVNLTGEMLRPAGAELHAGRVLSEFPVAALWLRPV